MHTGMVALMAVVFTATGFVLWNQRTVSPTLLDQSLWAHDWLTYAAIVLLAMHVGDIGMAAVMARINGPAAIAPHSET